MLTPKHLEELQQRAEKRKHDAAEAARILDQALTEANNNDTL